MKKQIYFLFGVFLLLFSCKKEKVPVVEEPTTEKLIRLSMQPTFGSQNLSLDSVYELDNGIAFKLSDIKVFFSDIQANNTLLKGVSLYDYRNLGKVVFTGPKPGVDIGTIQFGIGVPASLNHNDPSAFPASSPLNILIANDMHWDWNPGYIFFKIEGKADTVADASSNFDLNLSYHVGMDANFSTKTISGLSWSAVSSSLDAASLKLDFQKFFENIASPINIKSEYQTHSMPGQEAITSKVKTNFSESISAL